MEVANLIFLNILKIFLRHGHLTAKREENRLKIGNTNGGLSEICFGAKLSASQALIGCGMCDVTSAPIERFMTSRFYSRDVEFNIRR